MGQFASGSRKLHSEMDEPCGICSLIDLSNYFGVCGNDLSSPTVIQVHTVVFFPQGNKKKTTNKPLNLTSFLAKGKNVCYVPVTRNKSNP